MAKDAENRFRSGVVELKISRNAPLIDLVNDEIAGLDLPGKLTGLELIELGSVYVDGVRSLNPGVAVMAGTPLRIHASPRRFLRPSDLRERIVADTADTVLVEKPAGIPVEAEVDNFRENLLSFLEDERGQVLYPVHRLTIESEGLLLFAKTQEAQERLKKAFADGRIQRVFVVHVDSPAAPGEYSLASEDGFDDCRLRILNCDPQVGETDLISEGRQIWRITSGTLKVSYRLELVLDRGRPQQMRKLLANLGAPVVGDRSFGSKYQIGDLNSGKASMAVSLKSILES